MSDFRTEGDDKSFEEAVMAVLRKRLVVSVYVFNSNPEDVKVEVSLLDANARDFDGPISYDSDSE